jgi:serine O-acetyltransferase
MRDAFATFLADLRAPVERDPAAEGWLDVFLSYPGFHAITAHRAIHALWQRRVPLLPRLMSEIVHRATGIDIHPGATIGPGFFIDHGTGVVIGGTAIVGRDVTIYQGVTLGGTSLQRKKRHPTLCDNVVGIPGRVVLQDGRPIAIASPRPQVDLPDPGATEVAELRARIAALEARLAELVDRNDVSTPL